MLSVIVPVYNRERYLASALRSLVRQSGDVAMDIVVIDDGSTDGSGDVARAFMREAPCIRLFQQSNQGVAGARNTGLEQLLPQTQYVSFLDSDDISPAGRFKTDLACFADDPELDLTYSLMNEVDSIDDESLLPAVDCRSVITRGAYLGAGIFRRRLVERVGGFDDSLAQAEDIDYLLRLFESSPRFSLPDTIAVYYRHHPGNMTKQTGIRLRYHLRAIQKSMRRRKADPSLRGVEGIFQIKSPADWRAVGHADLDMRPRNISAATGQGGSR
jgi:glycosyltransferase involved in cell wall biosynthesis